MDKFEPKFILGNSPGWWGRMKFMLDSLGMVQVGEGSLQQRGTSLHYSATRLDVKMAIRGARLAFLKKCPGSRIYYRYIDRSDLVNATRLVSAHAVMDRKKLSLGCVDFTGKSLETLIKWARTAR